jgi:predicted acylesterase/phospholipase RssA
VRRRRGGKGGADGCTPPGAANSYYHIGVVKCLLERGVLPKHISGASGGSMVASYVCTHTNAELSRLLRRPDVLCKVFRPVGALSWSGLLARLVRTGHVFDLDEWEAKLREGVCGDFTFDEVRGARCCCGAGRPAG